MDTNPLDPAPNPYQSPASDLATTELGTLPDGSQIRGKLFSPGHVAWAAFLATPIAGCVLMAINYQRLQKSTAAIVMWFVTIVATSIWLLLAALYLDEGQMILLSIVLIFTLFFAAKRLQGNDVNRVIATGGKWASGWLATGIAILCYVALFAAYNGVLQLLPDEMFMEEGEL